MAKKRPGVAELDQELKCACVLGKACSEPEPLPRSCPEGVPVGREGEVVGGEKRLAPMACLEDEVLMSEFAFSRGVSRSSLRGVLLVLTTNR